MKHLIRLAIGGIGALCAFGAAAAQAQEPVDVSDIGAMTNTEGLDDLYAWLAALEAQKEASPPAAEVEQPAVPTTPPADAPATSQVPPAEPASGCRTAVQLPATGRGATATPASMIAIAVMLLAAGGVGLAAARTRRSNT